MALVGKSVALVGHAELNRTEVTVVGWNQRRGLYKVQLDDGTFIRVEPERLHFEPADNFDDHVEAIMKHGEMLEALGHYSAAAESYSALLPLLPPRHPNTFSTWLNIGLAYKRAFRWKSAHDAYVKAAQNASSREQHEIAMATLAKMLQQLNETEDDGQPTDSPERLQFDLPEAFMDALRSIFRPHAESFIARPGGAPESQLGHVFGFEVVSPQSVAQNNRELFLAISERPHESPPHLDAVWVFSWCQRPRDGVRRLSPDEVAAIPHYCPALERMGQPYINPLVLDANPTTLAERVGMDSAGAALQHEKTRGHTRLPQRRG